MDIFLFKKFVGSAFMPLPVLFFLLLLTLIFLIKKQRNKAIILQCFSLIFLALIANKYLAFELMAPTEQTYKQFDRNQSVGTIVVLGCGHINDGMLPQTAQLHSCSLYRLAEAMRIYHLNPQSQIITTGYGGNEPFSNADLVRQVAISMGIPGNKIRAISHPRDTEEEAKAVRKLLGQKPFVLVTSASHMPRAMSIFEAEGMHPMAAPTGHMAKDPSRAFWWEQLPQANSVRLVERWWYETLGKIWFNLRH